MDFQMISASFNRALALTFSKKRLALVFAVLALSGMLVVFFRGLAVHAGHWVQLSLTFLPIFVCTGILLSTGILLIRLYHDEVKKRETLYREVASKSWEEMIGASYFAIPIILCYVLLWILLGVFVLLEEIPLFGEFFSVILAFAPFMINLGMLLLCLASLFLLFFVAPVIALKGMDRNTVIRTVVQRMEKDPLANAFLLFIGLLPLLIVVALLTVAALLTGSICLDCQTTAQVVLKWFVVMLPFTAFLTPTVIFFFHFAAEAHVLMQKYMRSSG